MITQYISSYTTLSLVNTISKPGTIALPQSNLIGGRHINFKDMLGTFNTNNLTIQCSGSDTFEDGTQIKTLQETYGTIELVSNESVWYIINGTQVNMLQTNIITASSISTSYISTSSASISSLSLLDPAGDPVVLHQKDGYLYINNFLIGNVSPGAVGGGVF